MIHQPSPDLESIGTTDALFPVVYGELKRIARRYLRGSGTRVTVCTTELVHEAYLRLSERDGVAWQNRAHFFGSAARAMRQVLVDFARRRQAHKRNGTPISLSLADRERALEFEFEEIIAIDDALTQLDTLNPRLRQIVELRFFAGIREPEIAELLGPFYEGVKPLFDRRQLARVHESRQEEQMARRNVPRHPAALFAQDALGLLQVTTRGAPPAEEKLVRALREEAGRDQMRLCQAIRELSSRSK